GLGVWWYPKILTRYGIDELEVQGISLTQHRLGLARLSLTRQTTGQRMRLVATDVQLSWSWPEGGWRPQPEVLEVGALHLQAWSGTPQADQPPWWREVLSDSQHWRWPDWLPQKVRLHTVELELPCADDRC